MSGARTPEESCLWQTLEPFLESGEPGPAAESADWQTLVPAHLLKSDVDEENCKTLVPLALALEFSNDVGPEPSVCMETSDCGPTFHEAPQEEVIFGEAVWLHVYDLTDSFHLPILNSALRHSGAGLFHAGIEVHGWEYSFGLRERGTGVYACQPKRNASHAFRESLLLGYTALDQKDVKTIVKELKKEWPGRSYGPLSRNCIHFSAALAERLGAGLVPRWVHGLAGSLRSLVDRIADCSESVARLADDADCSGVIQILDAHEEIRSLELKRGSGSTMRL